VEGVGVGEPVPLEQAELRLRMPIPIAALMARRLRLSIFAPWWYPKVRGSLYDCAW
jgi:hypothetical protein